MSTAVETPPATQTAPAAQLTKETYKSKVHPDWCPGCGDFSVLAALQAALFELGLKPHQVLSSAASVVPQTSPASSTATACTPCTGAPWRSAPAPSWAITSLKSSAPEATATAMASAAIISSTPCAG